MLKRILSFVLVSILLISMLVSCKPDYSEPSGQVSNKKYYFHAIVLDVYDRSIMVSPVDGAAEGNSSDLISVSLTLKSGEVVGGIEKGDKVRIVYSGEIMESYPAQIAGVYEIAVVEKGAQDDSEGIDGQVPPRHTFIAEVLEVYDGSILVKSDEETADQMAFDRVVVHLNLISGETASGFEVGDKVSITFNGQVMQSLPAQIGGVYDIHKITE